jgi:hypothetical protein
LPRSRSDGSPPRARTGAWRRAAHESNKSSAETPRPADNTDRWHKKSLFIILIIIIIIIIIFPHHYGKYVFFFFASQRKNIFPAIALCHNIFYKILYKL